MSGLQASFGVHRARLFWILAAALAARWATFGNPIVHVDESFYLTVAEAMTRGQLPYVDIWDRKPIGLFLLYLPEAFAPLRLAVPLYQLEALGAAVATAVLVAHIADRLGWRRGALPAAIAYLFCLDFAGGQGGQAPVFFNMVTAAAAAIILANQERRWAADAVAMLLVGVALQIKYSVVFEGLFFGLVASGWPRSRLRWAARAVSLAALALTPTLIAAGAYAALGELGAFVFANFESVLLRPAAPAAERFGRLGSIALILSPLVVASIASARWQPLTRERQFVFVWLVVALAGIILFGGWLDHYALPAMLPGAIGAAGFFQTLAERRQFASTALALALLAVGAEATLLRNRQNRGDQAQFAALTAAVERAPAGCLFVYSGPALLYPATHRCSLTRFLFPGHLYKEAETPAIGIDQGQELRRILAARPAVIVVRPWTRGERLDRRAQLFATVDLGYRLAARLPLGRETLAVLYRRSGA